MKVSYSALTYSSALTVSGELRMTLSFLSTRLPPCAHSAQCSQVLASPEAWPSAKPDGVLFFFSALQSSRKRRGVLREFLEARLLHRGDAVVHQAAGGRDRNADPFVAGLAVGLGGRRPAAVLLAEVIGDIGQVDALRREQVRQRIEAPHHVEALAGVGDDRGLRLDVLERFVRDDDVDAGRLLEGVDHLHEGLVFGLHEAAPAHQVDLRAFLGLPRARPAPRPWPSRAGPGRSARWQRRPRCRLASLHGV